MLFIAFFRTSFTPTHTGSLTLPAEIVFFFSLGNVGLFVAFNMVPHPALGRLGALRAPAAGALLADLFAHPALHDVHRDGLGRHQLPVQPGADHHRFPTPVQLVAEGVLGGN